MYLGPIFTRFGAVAAIVNVVAVGVAGAVPLDMTPATGGFSTSDPAFVQQGTSVNDATLREDPVFGVTFLANDPFVGESGVLVPSDATRLIWDYHFSTTGNDSFSLTLLDAAGGPNLFQWLHDGSLLGPGVFSGDDVEIDLAALGLQGKAIGMEFLLIANLGDASVDSTVRFSDVRFAGKDSEVPIVDTQWLCLLGLLPLGFRSLKKGGQDKTKKWGQTKGDKGGQVQLGSPGASE